jgi:hypothetical protein
VSTNPNAYVLLGQRSVQLKPRTIVIGAIGVARSIPSMTMPTFPFVPASCRGTTALNSRSVLRPNTTYRYCSASVSGTVNVPSSTIIEIDKTLQVASRSRLAPAGASCPVDIDTLPHVYVGGAVTFFRQTRVWANVWAKGRLNLGNATDLHGRFWGDTIVSDFNVHVNVC